MGGGGFLGDVVKTVSNPVGYASNQLLGKNNDISKAANVFGNPMALASHLLGGKGNTSQAVSGQDALGRPILKNFDSQLTDTGQIKDAYQIKDTLNRDALTASRNEALRDPGTMSKWGTMALSQARNQNAASMAGQQQQARSSLAMQGGLRSGARERLASQGMQQQLQGNQSALGSIQMQDEQNRQKWLQMQPGLELQDAQYNTTIQDRNIGRATSELQQGRDYDKYRYGQEMTAWGADKSSDAMKQSAEAAKSTSGLFGGGGFLGLGL